MSRNDKPSTGPFPPPASTDSFWRSELHELDNHQSTPFPETADILIIGGGYSGIAASYHLLCNAETKVEPLPNVVLLEARGACSGATGRNGQLPTPLPIKIHVLTCQNRRTLTTKCIHTSTEAHCRLQRGRCNRGCRFRICSCPSNSRSR